MHDSKANQTTCARPWSPRRVVFDRGVGGGPCRLGPIGPGWVEALPVEGAESVRTRNTGSLQRSVRTPPGGWPINRNVSAGSGRDLQVAPQDRRASVGLDLLEADRFTPAVAQDRPPFGRSHVGHPVRPLPE
jgi:hypothetical protein